MAGALGTGEGQGLRAIYPFTEVCFAVAVLDLIDLADLISL